MKFILTILIPTLLSFNSLGQINKLASILNQDNVKITFTLVLPNSWTPYKDNFKNIIQIKKQNDSTAYIRYAFEKYMDSETEIKWIKKVDNKKIEKFYNRILTISTDAVYSLESYASFDMEYPQDHILIQTKEDKISFFVLGNKGRNVMDILLD